MKDNALQNTKSSRSAFFCIILAGILWGTSALFVNWLSPCGLDSIQMAFVRALVSALAMCLYALFFDRSLFKATRSQLFMYAISGVVIFLTGACYFGSILESSVSTAVVLMYIAPVIVMVYSVLFLGEKLTKIKLISLVGMLMGCALVSGIIGGFNFKPLGILLGIMSGFAYAAYNISTKIEMQHKCNPASASMYCFIFMTVVSAFFARPAEVAAIAVSEPSSALLMVGCGLFTCVFPYFLYTLALKNIPAGTASSLSIVEPMSATILSVVFLDEKLDLFSACGIVLILGAVFLLSRE